MALDFQPKDILHRITAKFVHSYLPTAKKKYHLRAVLQPEMDLHGIASKAEVYNITTDPKVIEEGMTAGMELIYYLAADGFKIKTPVFNLHIRLPGEYDGAETALAEGTFPEARLQTSLSLRNYIKERVKVDIDGVDATDGIIGEITDEATGLVDQAVTVDNILAVRGYGLKVEADAEHTDEAGVFFTSPDGQRYRAKALAVNEPHLLKVIAPPELAAGSVYHVEVVTQSSARGGGSLLKELRRVESDIELTAQS
jgi:hypothetical protein